MEIQGYSLINEEKVQRALNGTQKSDGLNNGGVLKADGSYDDLELLAEYDRLGGLIRRGEDKVKTGSFYDFKNKKPRKTPEVVFVYMVNGNVVEVEDGVELPGEVKAVKLLGKKTTSKITRKVKEEVSEDNGDEEAPVKVSRRGKK